MYKRLLLLAVFLFGGVLFAAPNWFDTALPGVQVMDVKLYKSQLWIATYGKGIFCYDYKSDSWENYCTANHNSEDDFFHSIAVSDDYIWAGTSEGLLIYDRKKEFWKKRKFVAGGEYGNWIRALYFDQNDNVLWIGRFQYLSHLDVRKQKFEDINLQVGSDDRSNNIKSIAPEGKNYIWIGTESGAFCYDKKMNPADKSSYEYYNNREGAFRGLGDYVSVASILAEQEFVWFSTEEFITIEKPHFNLGGLFKFDHRAAWTKFDQTTGLPANGVKTAARLGNQLWLGVYSFDKEEKNEIGQGISILNLTTGGVKNIRLDDIKAESNLVRTLLFDGDVLWIGTDKGLYRIYFTNPFAVFTLKKNIKK